MARLAARLLVLLGLTAWAGAALGATVRPTPAGPIKYTFDLTVSLEWAPAADDRLRADLALAGCAATALATPGVADPTVIDDLKAGLGSMASYFYSYTGGQMAIGKVTIHTGGVNWETADIRVLANRSYRPSAFIGGITSAPRRYEPPARPGETIVFQPGGILLSRLWDGEGSRCGGWSTPAGWRTLAHEWAHYALYLYDEYHGQRSGSPQYCGAGGGLPIRPARGAPAAIGAPFQSLMAYHYYADQLSLWGAAGPPPDCAGTPQTDRHGEPGWATAQRFYPELSAPAPGAPPFAGGPPPPPEFVIAASPRAGSSSAGVRAEGLPSGRQVAQAYLIRPNPDLGGAPLTILGQGSLLPGEATPLRFLGVEPALGDRAAVVVPGYRGGPRRGYPLDYRRLGPADALRTGSAANLLPTTESSWQPSLTIDPLLKLDDPAKPETGAVTGLRVRLSECGPKKPVKVELFYCPAGGSCAGPVEAAPQADGSFAADFSFPAGAEPADHGYIYAREPLRGAETVSWYQLAGGVGPAHSDGHAPLSEGELNVDMAQNEPGPHNRDSRVIYSPAQFCAAPQPLPAGVIDLVGQPYSVQVVLGDQGGGRPWASELPARPLRVRLNYDQDLLDRLGVDEAQLVVLREVQGGWELVPAVGRSPELNWIMAEPRLFGPDGEIYALGLREARLMLPLLSGPPAP